MKFSRRWLGDWVPIDISTPELCEQLSNAGLEVDGVLAVADDLPGVVVATVESVEPHPDADKLKVCIVNDGNDRLTVVCGAPNVRAKMTGALARVGGALPNGTKVKRAKLRGVESHGMLCSELELGLGDDDSGILDLGRRLRPRFGRVAAGAQVGRRACPGRCQYRSGPNPQSRRCVEYSRPGPRSRPVERQTRIAAGHFDCPGDNGCGIPGCARESGWLSAVLRPSDIGHRHHQASALVVAGNGCVAAVCGRSTRWLTSRTMCCWNSVSRCMPSTWTGCVTGSWCATLGPGNR